MKKLLSAVLLTAAAVMPAAAFADSLTAEVRLSDPRANKADATEFRVEAWKKAFGGLLVGGELQARQPENEGKLTSIVSVKAGAQLDEFVGFKPVVYAEVGQRLADRAAGGNIDFWGAGLKVNRPVAAGFTVNGGYRHREGFNNARLNEDRVHAGVSYALSKRTEAGVTYYRTRSGGVDTDAIGLGLTTKF